MKQPSSSNMVEPFLKAKSPGATEWQDMCKTKDGQLKQRQGAHQIFIFYFPDFALILPEISLMCFVFITENYTTNYTWTMY